MTPQCALLLAHLNHVGTISGVEAAAIHKIRHLPRRVADLKAAGWPVTTAILMDITGQRYARYSMIAGAVCVPPLELPLAETVIEQEIIEATMRPTIEPDTTTFGGVVYADDGFEQIDIRVDADQEFILLCQAGETISLTGLQISHLWRNLRLIEGKIS